VGFLDEACPHRGISLSLGRNENAALTCIFHGWSFNAKGECIATPTESNKDFCKKVRVRAYPIREMGGAIWVYLAPGVPAKFPALRLNDMRPEDTYCRRGLMRANWSHTVEQFLDNVHVGFLHRNAAMAPDAPDSIKNSGGDTIVYHLEDQPYGYRAFVRRERPGGTTSIRVSEFLAPLGVLVATTEDEISVMAMIVPINDTASMFWSFSWGTPEQQARSQGGLTRKIGDPDDWIGSLLDRSKPNLGQDREAMKKGNWSGFNHLPLEDIVVAESMPIIDRTKEYLGTTDVAVIRLRRDLLKALHAIRDGNWTGRGDLSRVDYRNMRAMAMILPTSEDMVAHVNAKYAQRMAAE
jgi:hypothetical protein